MPSNEPFPVPLQRLPDCVRLVLGIGTILASLDRPGGKGRTIERLTSDEHVVHSSRPDNELLLPPPMAAKNDRRVTTGFVWLEVVSVVWLYYSLLVVCIAVPPFAVQALGYQLNLRQGTAVTFGCTLVAELTALGLLWLWTRRQALSWKDLGWRQPTTSAALVLAIVVSLGYSAFTLLLPEVRQNALELSVFKLWGAAIGFVAAAIEEFYFRGFILTKLELRGTNRALQVLVSGITFGIVHPGFGLWGMLMTFLLGIALALIYLAGKRSLTGPILCHGLINVVIEPWLLLYMIELYARMFAF